MPSSKCRVCTARHWNRITCCLTSGLGQPENTKDEQWSAMKDHGLWRMQGDNTMSVRAARSVASSCTPLGDAIIVVRDGESETAR